MEEEKNISAAHSIIMEGRERISISGVLRVDDFCGERITADTCVGGITLTGEDLHVEKLDLASGELCITGRVDSLAYSAASSRPGFWSRLF